MSNIPNSAMPHAGGNSTKAEDGRQSTQNTGTRADNPTTSYGNQDTSRSQQSDINFAAGGPVSRQPDRDRETNSQRERSSSVMEKARNHKTGIAVGVAVGAIAAVALPFMLSGKKKSSDRRDIDYSADVHVDNRDSYASGRPEGVVTSDSRTVGSTSTTPVAGSGDLRTASGGNKSTYEA